MGKKYNVREITPKANMCIASACPAIYEITPKENMCLTCACPSIYEDKSGKYLIIGKKENPSEFGLEKKVGKDEVLSSVPKKLIDNMKK